MSEASRQMFLNGRVTLNGGDCLDVLRSIGDASIDAVVTDPPYALTQGKRGGIGEASLNPNSPAGRARISTGFMGKTWDTGERAFAVEFWAEVYRVLKPGGHVAAFGGTRTYHRLTCAIEDAGFEVRDRLSYFMAADTHVVRFMESLSDEQRWAFMRCMEESQFGGELAWVFGSGFPKSHDVAKGIDKKAGAQREVIGSKLGLPGYHLSPHDGGEAFGAGLSSSTAVSRAKSAEVTAAATLEAKQWEGWGSALKPALEPICLARKPLEGTIAENVLTHGTGALNIAGCRVAMGHGDSKPIIERSAREVSRENYRTGGGIVVGASTEGRWPANVLHDGSDEVAEHFPASDGSRIEKPCDRTFEAFAGGGLGGSRGPRGFADSGSAARFFYSAKADADDRIGSKHPTVKPVDLMRWLVRLVTPPGGTVLDPFAGTGTTGEAAFREGFKAVLVEREEEYRADIARRMALCLAGPDERTRTIIKEKMKGRLDDHGPLFATGSANGL